MIKDLDRENGMNFQQLVLQKKKKKTLNNLIQIPFTEEMKKYSILSSRYIKWSEHEVQIQIIVNPFHKIRIPLIKVRYSFLI